MLKLNSFNCFDVFVMACTKRGTQNPWAFVRFLCVQSSYNYFASQTELTYSKEKPFHTSREDGGRRDHSSIINLASFQVGETTFELT